MNKFTKTAIAMATITITASVFAKGPGNTVGGTSLNERDYAVKTVKIGNSVNKRHQEYVDKAGINIEFKDATGNTLNNKFQSFERIASMEGKLHTRSVISKTNEGIYLGRMYDMPKMIAWFPGMPEHRDGGRMSFKQVGDADVWFGDWEDMGRNDSSDIKAGSYTVYYAGTDQSTTLPTDTVTYNVTGINKIRTADDEVLKGTLTADFGNAKKVTGSISRSDLTIGVDANIRGANFNGTATANGARGGKSEGKFYGHKADTMAGMATFRRDHSKDTAFGGKKN